jgi:Flp pilus assembly protein TadG
MVMKRRLTNSTSQNSRLRQEAGSITAELAMALPAVSLVIAITLSAFALQIERMKLVDVAATAARAVARGEPEESVRASVAELIAPLEIESVSMTAEVRESVTCVILSRQFELPGLGEKFFDISEIQCARKMGL